jgi:hypothetical protein
MRVLVVICVVVMLCFVVGCSATEKDVGSISEEDQVNAVVGNQTAAPVVNEKPVVMITFD